jgi:hypothetical protein
MISLSLRCHIAANAITQAEADSDRQHHQGERGGSAPFQLEVASL